MNQTAVNFDQLVRARRSVRGFSQTPVAKETLTAIFETARWAPSGTNIQPWKVFVASGSACDQIRAEFLRRFDAGESANTDHRGDGKIGDVFKNRRRACAKVLYDAMSIEWEDREGRGRAARRNFEFFDAPHVAFIGMDEAFGMQSASDVGMFAQTLMLAMTAHGVASCAQGTLRNYPDFVREFFSIPEETKILFGISFGYEAEGIPANEARTERAEVDEFVQFVS
ncbi:MAG: nitroreductase [Pseudomonadales bacterium]|jgi:nitroreductase